MDELIDQFTFSVDGDGIIVHQSYAKAREDGATGTPVCRIVDKKASWFGEHRPLALWRLFEAGQCDVLQAAQARVTQESESMQCCVGG